jgi:DNA polymerase-3 subunit delta
MAARRKGSGPHGGVALREVRKRIRGEGWPCGLTVLTGDDLFHLDAAQREILEHLVPGDHGAYGWTVFGDREVDAAEVVAAASCFGMFASRRVVLVRDVEALKERRRPGEPGVFAAYGSAPPSDSYIIVRAPKLDQRLGLQRELAASGLLVAFQRAEPSQQQELAAEAAALARERGLTLEADECGLLLELAEHDLYRVVSELDKLWAWKSGGASPRVTRAEVLAVASGGGALSGWELSDAVLARDRADAVVSARRLAGAGEEPIRIVGGLAYRARTMLQAKALLEAGESREGTVTALRAWGYRDKLLDGVSRYTLDELLTQARRLLHADRTLKSRRLDPRAVLESLAEDLTAPAPKRS